MQRLLPSSIPLSCPTFLGFYILAQAAGVLSNIPGGLGVFETAMLLSLKPLISSETLIGALLAFRGIYYILPLMLSVFALGLYEIRRKRTRMLEP